MEPPRSPPLAADSDEEERFREFFWDYCHSSINNMLACVASPTVVPKDTDVIDVDGDAPRTQHEDDDIVLALCQSSQREDTKTQEESSGLVAAQPGSNSKMFVAAVAANPLQLSIGTHGPGANHMSGSSSSIAFSKYTGSGINLNLLPPEKKTVAIPNNASPSLKPLHERPLLGLIGKKDPPPFAPVILESSEVAVLPSVNMAPAKAKHKRRRHYIWPASKVAQLDEKIEQLRKEALLRPADRRLMTLIEKDIDELQGKKDEIHARMLAVMREDDDRDEAGSSTQ